MIPKETYPDGFPMIHQPELIEGLVYLGTVFFELGCRFDRELLKSEDERFVFITGLHPYVAERIESRTLRMSEGKRNVFAPKHTHFEYFLQTLNTFLLRLVCVHFFRFFCFQPDTFSPLSKY